MELETDRRPKVDSISIQLKRWVLRGQELDVLGGFQGDVSPAQVSSNNYRRG